MDIRKIKKLIELLEESGIAEIEIKEGEESVRINRGVPVQAAAPVHDFGSEAADRTPPNRADRPIDLEAIHSDNAVTAPRFNTDHHQDSFNPARDRDKAFVKAGSLRVHSGVRKQVQEDLRDRGHDLTATDSFIARPVMLYINQENGLIHAAGDPAAARHAAAID